MCLEIVAITIFNYVNLADLSQYPGKKQLYSIILMLFLCMDYVLVSLGLHRVGIFNSYIKMLVQVFCAVYQYIRKYEILQKIYFMMCFWLSFAY